MPWGCPKFLLTFMKKSGIMRAMEMSRSWSSAHDWKSCIPQKGIESSNLSISAILSERNPLHPVLRRPRQGPPYSVPCPARTAESPAPGPAQGFFGADPQAARFSIRKDVSAVKTLYLVGGPMGVGKTAVCQRLKRDLPGSRSDQQHRVPGREGEAHHAV